MERERERRREKREERGEKREKGEKKRKEKKKRKKEKKKKRKGKKKRKKGKRKNTLVGTVGPRGAPERTHTAMLGRKHEIGGIETNPFVIGAVITARFRQPQQKPSDGK